MRKPFICGNWKMNKTLAEALAFVNEVMPRTAAIEKIDVGIAAPFVQLAGLAPLCRKAKIRLGGQDCYWKESGAFTGEISAPMLRDVGCQFVIIGHSERRQFFGDSDEWVNQKVAAARKAELDVILCVGETREQREKGVTNQIVVGQIQGGLKNMAIEQLANIVVAYEPVWAIGTGLTATPAQAQDVHKVIRNEIARLYNDDAANSMRILYGGSVDPNNVKELMAQEDIDGALVGGASLVTQKFLALCSYND